MKSTKWQTYWSVVLFSAAFSVACLHINPGPWSPYLAILIAAGLSAVLLLPFDAAEIAVQDVIRYAEAVEAAGTPTAHPVDMDPTGPSQGEAAEPTPR